MKSIYEIEHEFECEGCKQTKASTLAILTSDDGYKCQCGQVTKATLTDSETGKSEDVHDAFKQLDDTVKNFGKSWGK